MEELNFSPENELSGRLQELRCHNRLTQRQVAEKLHVDRSTYSYYETGKTLPGIRTLMRLSSLYGVSIDFIVGNGAKKAPAAKPEPETAEKALNPRRPA